MELPYESWVALCEPRNWRIFLGLESFDSGLDLMSSELYPYIYLYASKNWIYISVSNSNALSIRGYDFAQKKWKNIYREVISPVFPLLLSLI